MRRGGEEERRRREGVDYADQSNLSVRRMTLECNTFRGNVQ